MQTITKLAILLSIFTAIACFSCQPSEEPGEQDNENVEDDNNDDNGGDYEPGDIDYGDAVVIAYSDDGTTVTNPFSGAGVTVENDSGHIVVNSTFTDKEITYVLTGAVSDGSFKIYGEYKFVLALGGVDMTNPKGAAINIQCGKKVTVMLIGDTLNSLADGTEYDTVSGEDMKAAFFSEGQLNFYGTGRLTVAGKYKHAICTDDYFKLYDGNITVTEAAGDAIHANDYIEIEGGSLTLSSSGEGLDCEKGYVSINGGDIQINTTGNKGHAVKSAGAITVDSGGSIGISVSGVASKGFSSTGDMVIKRGDIRITTNGGAVYEDADFSSAAGIKCDGNLLIDGGTIVISSSGKGGKGISVDGTLVMNDGIVTVETTGDNFTYSGDNTAAKAVKSDGELTINGGSLKIKTTKTEAEGLESKTTLTINGGTIEIDAYDDGINASQHIAVNGGTVYCNSTVNDAIDSNGTLEMTGGIVIASGAAAPEGAFDCDRNQFKITGGTLVGIGGNNSTPTSSVTTQNTLLYSTSASYSVIYIQSSDGTDTPLIFKLSRTYSGTKSLLFSSPLIKSGGEYKIYTGGTITGGSEFHGLYTDAQISGGSLVSTFTAQSVITTIGNSGGGGGKP